MRLYGLLVEEIEGVVVPGNLRALDAHNRPIFDGRGRDGQEIEVVMALDVPDFVITVFAEKK